MESDKDEVNDNCSLFKEEKYKDHSNSSKLNNI